MSPRSRLLTIALLAPPLLFLGLFFFVPLAATLETAFTGTRAWGWTTSDYVRGRLGIALLQAVLSVVLTFAVAVPLAWLHHRHRLPFSRIHLAVHAAPFVLPVFVVVYGIRGLLGPNGWTQTLFHIDALAWLGPLGTVVVAHAYYNYGFAARILHAQLERRPHHLEEAARSLGAGPWATMRRITLPLLAPSMLAVALLVFLFAFTSFGVVLFLGEGQVSTLETMLYQNLGGAFPRLDRAAALGVIQLAINAAVFMAYLHLRAPGKGPVGAPRGLQHEPARRAPRGHAAVHTTAWALLALGLLPALSVLTQGFRVNGAWSTDALHALTDPAHPAHVAGFDLGRATLLSIGYAIATLAASLTLTLMLAYGARRQRPLARRATELIAALPLGTSSLLIGLGYLLAFGAGSIFDLRGQPGLIVVAHTLVAFPFTARILLPAIDLADRRLEEAAMTLGADKAGLLMRIRLPLLKGPLLAASGFALAMSLGDFGASLLLMRPDTMSLSVWIAQHDAPFRDIMRAQATLLSGILMLLATGAYLAMEALGRDTHEVFG